MAPWIVTAHTVVAIVIVLLLLCTTVCAMYRMPGHAAPTSDAHGQRHIWSPW
ncbi:MAG: hypothetical protein R2712_25590 [Vicinamibacterales bacterium]